VTEKINTSISGCVPHARSKPLYVLLLTRHVHMLLIELSVQNRWPVDLPCLPAQPD